MAEKLTKQLSATDKKVEDLTKVVIGHEFKTIIKLPDYFNAPDTENISITDMINIALTNIENPSDFYNEYLFSTPSEISTWTGNYKTINVKEQLGSDCEVWYMLNITAAESNKLMYFELTKELSWSKLDSNIKIVKNADNYPQQIREVEVVTPNNNLKVHFALPTGLYFVGINSNSYVYSLTNSPIFQEALYGHIGDLYTPMTNSKTVFYIENDTNAYPLKEDGVNIAATGTIPVPTVGNPPLKFINITKAAHTFNIIPNTANPDKITAFNYRGDYGIYHLPVLNQWYHALPGTNLISVYVKSDSTDCSGTKYELLLQDITTSEYSWSEEYTWGINTEGFTDAFKIFSNTPYYTPSYQGYAYPVPSNFIHIPGKRILGFYLTYFSGIDRGNISVYGYRSLVQDDLYLEDNITRVNNVSYALNPGITYLKAVDTQDYLGRRFLVPYISYSDATLGTITVVRTNAEPGVGISYIIKEYDRLGSITTTNKSTFDETFNIEFSGDKKVTELIFLDDVLVFFPYAGSGSYQATYETFVPALDGKLLGKSFILPMRTESPLSYMAYCPLETNITVYKTDGTIYITTKQAAGSFSSIPYGYSTTFKITSDSPVSVLCYGTSNGVSKLNGGATIMPNFAVRKYSKSYGLNDFTITDYVSVGPYKTEAIEFEKTFDVSEFFSEAAYIHWIEYGFENAEISTPKISCYVSYSQDNITWTEEYQAMNHSVLPSLAEYGELNYIKVRFYIAADPTVNDLLFTDNHFVKDIKLEYYTWKDLEV